MYTKAAKLIIRINRISITYMKKIVLEIGSFLLTTGIATLAVYLIATAVNNM